MWVGVLFCLFNAPWQAGKLTHLTNGAFFKNGVNKMDLKIKDLDKDYSADSDVAQMYICENNKGEEVFFDIARSGTAAHEKLQRSYAKRLEISRRQPKKQKLLYAEIAAKHTLKGLGKLLDDNGKAVESTVANKISILLKYEGLFRDILEFSLDIRNYQEFDEEEEEGSADLTSKEDTEKNSKT